MARRLSICLCFFTCRFVAASYEILQPANIFVAQASETQKIENRKPKTERDKADKRAAAQRQQSGSRYAAYLCFSCMRHFSKRKKKKLRQKENEVEEAKVLAILHTENNCILIATPPTD